MKRDNDVLYCRQCGAVRLRLPDGYSVCPYGHGRLMRAWDVEDLPVAIPAGTVRIPKSDKSGSTYSATFTIDGLDGRFGISRPVGSLTDQPDLAENECLAVVVYSQDRHRTAVLRRMESTDLDIPKTESPQPTKEKERTDDESATT